jgi:Homeodomain-like domain
VLLRHYLEQGMDKVAIARDLGISRRTVYHWIETGQLDRERGLESSFSYFGSVPNELLFDQMKAVVLSDGRGDDGPLVENSEFVRYAHHWSFRIRACRPYRAQTKGKVERPIRYLRESFFYGRTSTSDDDLNTEVLHWLDTQANVRIHGTLKERPVVGTRTVRPFDNVSCTKSIAQRSLIAVAGTARSRRTALRRRLGPFRFSVRPSSRYRRSVAVVVCGLVFEPQQLKGHAVAAELLSYIPPVREWSGS